MARKKNRASRQSDASSEDNENGFFSKSFAVALFGAFMGTLILLTSYNIRLMAIQEFGPVIHEFDPYFNLRATEVSLRQCTVYANFTFHSILNASHSSFSPFSSSREVPLRAWPQKILPMVRLHVLVSPRSPRGNHHLPRLAIHCSLGQESHRG